MISITVDGATGSVPVCEAHGDHDEHRPIPYYSVHVLSSTLQHNIALHQQQRSTSQHDLHIHFIRSDNAGAGRNDYNQNLCY